MKEEQAELLLAVLLLSRSTGFMFSKILLQTLSPLNLLTLRFVFAFLLLALVFFKRIRSARRRELFHGALLGWLLFMVMFCEMLSLQTTDTSATSFLENTSIVLVPLINSLIFRERPSRMTWICTLLAALGVSLMTLSEGQLHLTTGELLALGAAVFYAFTIICMSRFSREGDSFLLGILQVGFVGLFALCGSLFTGGLHLPSGPKNIGALAMQVVVCTGFGFTLQPKAQSYMRAERAALFCALSPVFAMMWGFLFLNERFTLLQGLGALLILSGLFLPKIAAGRQKAA